MEITDQKDEESLDVRDKVLSKRKEVKVNQMVNLEKAFQNSRNLGRNRASDMFLQMEK